MKDSRPWSHMSTRTTDGKYVKHFCQSVQEQRLDGKVEEKKLVCIKRERKKSRMEIAKFFALHTNAKKKKEKTRTAITKLFALNANVKT